MPLISHAIRVYTYKDLQKLSKLKFHEGNIRDLKSYCTMCHHLKKTKHQSLATYKQTHISGIKRYSIYFKMLLNVSVIK